jgi:DNA-binding response OmpR family regulator
MTTAHDARRIAELEAENAWLKAELGLRDERIPTLQRLFRLTPQEARVLSMIYSGRGRWVLKDFIEASLPEYRGERIGRTKIVMVYVSHLRTKFGRTGIISAGRGEIGAYRLSTSAVIRIDSALQSDRARTNSIAA